MNASAGQKKPIKIRSAYDPIWSAEGEQSVLGAILVRPEVLDRVVDLLDPEDFYQTAYARIFQAMLDLHRRSDPVDLVTVTALLKERGQLDGVGGYVFLAGLSEQVGFAINAGYYANLVHDKAILRRLLDTTQEIASACIAPVEDVPQFLDAAEKKIFSISQTGRQRSALPLSQLLPPEREIIESRHGSPDILGLKTGFCDLDKITGGFQPGNLIIPAARPGIGKTALALNITYIVATQAQVPVVFFSLEMSKGEVIRRLIANAGRLDLGRLAQGRLSAEEWSIFEKVSAELEEAPIFISDQAMLTPMEVRSQVRRLKAEHSIGLVVVDYLQLMKDPDYPRSREQEVASISRNLKAIAKEMEVPVIAMAQLNRRVEDRSDKRPQLADLRESGAIEQDADMVIFLHIKGENKENHISKIEVSIAKNRNGITGNTGLVFLKNYQRFENLAKMAQP